MFKANTAPTTTRRALALGAGAFASVGITAGVAATTAAPKPTLSPIMEAAARLTTLGKMGEEDAVLAEECRLADLITDNRPQMLADAAILLMVAAADIMADDFYDDGTHGRERGEIMVRRVMHFLADLARIDLASYGGTYFLSDHDHDALTGTVAEAARRFNRIDAALAQTRRDEYDAEMERQIIRAKNTPEDKRRVAEVVEQMLRRWDSISDHDPRLDGGRRLMDRISGSGAAGAA